MSKAAASAKPKVKPFLLVRIARAEPEAELLGLCAGYEAAAWRADGLAKSLIRNLPQFALPIEQWDDFNTATGVEQLSRAARAIYTTDKYHNRGEVGELLLFSIMREHYDSEPVVSKFYFKSSSNDTVKGFDAVHVVSGKAGLELWLGEVKFYSNISAPRRMAWWGHLFSGHGRAQTPLGVARRYFFPPGEFSGTSAPRTGRDGFFR